MLKKGCNRSSTFSSVSSVDIMPWAEMILNRTRVRSLSISLCKTTGLLLRHYTGHNHNISSHFHTKTLRVQFNSADEQLWCHMHIFWKKIHWICLIMLTLQLCKTKIVIEKDLWNVNFALYALYIYQSNNCTDIMYLPKTRTNAKESSQLSFRLDLNVPLLVFKACNSSALKYVIDCLKLHLSDRRLTFSNVGFKPQMLPTKRQVKLKLKHNAKILRN